MIVGFFIFVIIVALVAGFFLGRRREEAIVSNDIIEKINFAMGTENKTLKEENRTLQIKNLLFKEWLIRSYIEQYYRKKLLAGDHQIYTVDALADLNDYAKTALDNFKNTWNSKICNEQCDWIKEYLEVIICKTDTILNNNTWSDILNSENEDAFRRFFVSIENSMFFDRNAKENGDKREGLTYWEPAREHEDVC